MADNGRYPMADEGESAYVTLALARVGTERGAETSIGPWAEHDPRGESGSSGGAGVAGFHPSARDQRQVRTLTRGGTSTADA